MRVVWLPFVLVLLACGGGGGGFVAPTPMGTVRVSVRFAHADFDSWQHVNQVPALRAWMRVLTIEVLGSGVAPVQVDASGLSEHVLTGSASVPVGTYTVRFRAYREFPGTILGEGTATATVLDGQTFDLVAAAHVVSFATALEFTNEPYTANPGQTRGFTARLVDSGSNELMTIEENEPGFVWFLVSGPGTMSHGGSFQNMGMGTSQIRCQAFDDEVWDEAFVIVGPPPPPP